MNCTAQEAVSMIIDARLRLPLSRAALVGISGIDGSGKGVVAEQIEGDLGQRGFRIATINVDGWLQLPHRRFDPNRPADHFYESGIRFDEMFQRVVLPLRDDRSVCTIALLADAADTPAYRRHTFAFEDIDIILLEGIFLLRRDLRAHFDLTFWIDCTFETALERALARGQEMLPPERVVRDYQSMYFPAQRLHLERDDPRRCCTGRIINDHRLSAVASIAPPQQTAALNGTTHTMRREEAGR